MNTPPIKSSSALFLQGVIVLIGLATLGWMLWEPHLEGRNAHATMFEIYCKDPFLAYVYVGSIPFFVALYRAFGLFGELRLTGNFSLGTLNALRVIQRCGLAMLGFVAGAVSFILVYGDPEDRPPGIFMCLLAAFVASGIAIAATTFARNLQHTFHAARS